MKILHTSDWHLGHQLYTFERTEEHESMLRQMADIVASEKPDVFLLCGDVFDTSAPSASVNTMFVDAMMRIAEANPQMTIVVTAGNHDSASRHEVFSTPWKKLGIHAVGSLHSDNPDRHIIELGGKGYIVAVPYVHDRNMPEGFLQMLLDRVAERNTEGLPVVMTAHTTLEGSDFNGHLDITERSVGGIDGRKVADMGTGYDYLALGHIHRKQWVRNDWQNIRYSGSPIDVSFDEDFRHSVSIVKIERHGDTPLLKEIEIENPWPLVSLPQKGFTVWETAKELLGNFPVDKKAYIRLNIEVTDALPHGARIEAENMVRDKKCRICLINTQKKKEHAAKDESLTVEEFVNTDPTEIARRYLDSLDIKLEGKLAEMFSEALDAVVYDSQK